MHCHRDTAIVLSLSFAVLGLLYYEQQSQESKSFKVALTKQWRVVHNPPSSNSTTSNSTSILSFDRDDSWFDHVEKEFHHDSEPELRSRNITLVKLERDKNPLSGQIVSTYPYPSAYLFWTLCNAHFYTKASVTPKAAEAAVVWQNSIVCVKPDFIDLWFRVGHPEVRFPYILMTTLGDQCLPAEAKLSTAKQLDDPKLVRWYACNAAVEDNYDASNENLTMVLETQWPHPKLVGMPIGLATSSFHQGGLQSYRDAFQDTDATALLKSFLLLGSNSRTNLVAKVAWRTTSPKRKEPALLDLKERFNLTSQLVSFDDYVQKQLKTSDFIISPPGNGYDCHRTWEAILAGTVPVLKSSPIDHLFVDLPVIIVRSWYVVSEQFLMEQREHIIARLRGQGSRPYNLERAFAPYWINLVGRSQVLGVSGYQQSV